MKPKKAFTLIDVMLALIVLSLGTVGLLGVMETNKRAMYEEEEGLIANRLLYHLHTLPTNILEQSNGQTFDFRGLRQEPAVYTISVQSHVDQDYVIWDFEVAWETSSGVPMMIHSRRITWGGAQ